MKVKIGPYVSWIGPYQLSEKILFWIPKYDDKYEYTESYDKYVHRFGEWMADTWINSVCQWIHDKKKRKVKVHIDGYDVWSADHTMALIILPMLKKLKEVKHGCPYTYHEDGPWYYRFQLNVDEHNYNETGSYNQKRWDWILDEIIWAFEQLAGDDLEDWDSRYHHGVTDLYFEPCEDNPKLSEMKRGPKDTSWFDKEGHDNHYKCIDNGLRLFGKYYRNLWD